MRDRSGDKRTLAKPDRLLPWSNTSTVFFWILAELYEGVGRYAEAEPLFRRDLAITEKVRGPDHPDVALSLNNLALLYDDQGRYAEAEPLAKRSLAIREKTLGPDSLEVANSLNTLGAIYDNLGSASPATTTRSQMVCRCRSVLASRAPTRRSQSRSKS